MKRFVEYMYLNSNNLFASTQSAYTWYRQGHSIETALTRVNNDILMNLDGKGGETILILLDLTPDHELFIKRLKSRYGVGETAPNFSSYLHNRSQSVVVENVLSQPVKVDYGMP